MSMATAKWKSGAFHGHTYTELLPLLFQAGGFIFDDDMLLNLDQPAMYEGVIASRSHRRKNPWRQPRRFLPIKSSNHALG